MCTPDIHRQAIARLKQIQETKDQDVEMKGLIDAREAVLHEYQPLFQSKALDTLTAERFRDFLLFKNNRHWTGLHRMGPTITSDMEALREALHTLLDESQTIEVRLDTLMPKGTPRLKRLGKAVLTAILLVVHPDEYGVWNGTSEAAMQELGVWPKFEWGAPFGQRYRQVNEILKELAREVGVDLWTLDSLWWRVVKPEESVAAAEAKEAEEAAFGLERHLHDFLADNWEKTTLGKEWDLDEQDGDIKGYGYERPTPVGRIDLLAHDKINDTDNRRWLVIELKRGRTSDEALGQVQRYMGWVKEKLAANGATVQGLIIGREEDEQLRFALKVAPDVTFQRYEIDFRLLAPPE